MLHNVNGVTFADVSSQLGPDFTVAGSQRGSAWGDLNGAGFLNHATTSVGFMSSGNRRVHFGLGAEQQLESLELRWPSGRLQLAAFAARPIFHKESADARLRLA